MIEPNERFPRGAHFFIVRSDTGRALESYLYRPNAEEALKTLNQHEEQHGRGPDFYRLETRP